MTLEKFIKKHMDKNADFDGMYGAQCVDLFRYYIKEVLEDEQPEGVEGAKDFYFNYPHSQKLKKVFDLLPTSETPAFGDVAIFSPTSTNPYGHIAIVTDFFDGIVETFGQNGLSKHATCKKELWSSLLVLGYLRPINQDKITSGKS